MSKPLDSSGEAEFLSKLAHQLRGALGTLSLQLEIIRGECRSGASAGEIAESTDDLRRSITESLVGLDRLVYARRIERAFVDAKPVTLSLASAVQEQIDLQAAGAAPGAVTLRCSVPPNVQVRADKVLLGVAIQQMCALLAQSLPEAATVDVAGHIEGLQYEMQWRCPFSSRLAAGMHAVMAAAPSAAPNYKDEDELMCWLVRCAADRAGVKTSCDGKTHIGWRFSM